MKVIIKAIVLIIMSIHLMAGITLPVLKLVSMIDITWVQAFSPLILGVNFILILATNLIVFKNIARLLEE